MADNRLMRDLGAPVTINGECLEGVQSTSVPGAQSQRVPVRNVLAAEQQFVEDLPDPGTAVIVLSYNSGDPLHLRLAEWHKNRTTLVFTWLVQGKKVNGVNTRMAMTEGTSTGRVASSKFRVTSGLRPKVGDYLIPQGGQTLKITGIDYSTDPVQYVVVQASDNSAAATVNSDTPYTVKSPAIRWEWQGRLLGLPAQGGIVIVRSVNVIIEGEVRQVVGTPDLPA